MSAELFPVAIYRVVVSLSTKQFECRTTTIMARKTAGGYVTEHSRRLKQADIGVPSTRMMPGSPIWSVYVEKREDIDAATRATIERLRKATEAQHNHFAALIASLDAGPTFKQDKYSEQDL